MSSNVTRSQETKVTLCFDTPTHIFKISESKYEKLESDPKFFVKIARDIQKRMKQISNKKCTGKNWEDSWKAIFTEITGQNNLDW